MNLGIEGRRAAVAGASAGLGLAAAMPLAAKGEHVAICGLDRHRQHHRRSRQGGRGMLSPVVADVSTEEGAFGFVMEAAAKLGGVDILVANAGGPRPGGFAKTSLATFRKALDLNLLSSVAMCQAAVPTMSEAGWGRIVAVTSHVVVRQRSPFLISSATARTGLPGFLRVLANKLGPKGITVNSAQPGVHATDRMTQLGIDTDRLWPMIPTRSIGQPDDFGAAIAVLCSDKAKFITGVRSSSTAVNIKAVCERAHRPQEAPRSNVRA